MVNDGTNKSGMAKIYQVHSHQQLITAQEPLHLASSSSNWWLADSAEDIWAVFSWPRSPWHSESKLRSQLVNPQNDDFPRGWRHESDGTWSLSDGGDPLGITQWSLRATFFNWTPNSGPEIEIPGPRSGAPQWFPSQDGNLGMASDGLSCLK